LNTSTVGQNFDSSLIEVLSRPLQNSLVASGVVDDDSIEVDGDGDGDMPLSSFLDCFLTVVKSDEVDKDDLTNTPSNELI
jgi:hypothetical protein